MQQIYCKQKQAANAYYVTNLRRQHTTLCQRAQCKRTIDQMT
jgi:hypothetical protein